MTDAGPTPVALKNLRDFQEMSYSDVYEQIRQKRFEEAKAKYVAVLENMGIEQFDAAHTLSITTPHDNLLESMSEMAGNVSEPEKIRAVGFDLSAHAIHHDESGDISQGIEVSLYSEDVYDFAQASDEEITEQCEKPASEWQGRFMEIGSVALEGLGPIAQQFLDHAQDHENSQGIIESEDGTAIVDPIAIAKHVAKLLVAIEYHRFMAEFVSEVEVPSKMVFIIGEHDEIEVPILFYRVGENLPDLQADPQSDLPPEQTNEDHQELGDEDTPSLYQPIEEKMAVEEVQSEEPAASDVGTKLYEQAKAQAKESFAPVPVAEMARELEQAPEKLYEIPEDTLEETPIEPEEGQKDPASVDAAALAKSRLGSHLHRRPLGSVATKSSRMIPKNSSRLKIGSTDI